LISNWDGKPLSTIESEGSGLVMFRQLSLEDYERIMALWRRSGITSLKPRGRDSPEMFARQLRECTQEVIGVEVEGELVGVVVATHDGRKGWINRLAVDPAHRRQGWGARLIAAAEQKLRSRGIQIIAVLVEESNSASLALFQQQGYSLARDILYLSKRDSSET
jgi:ribosomal protein S18 acetylase RimI-like enzyme